MSKKKTMWAKYNDLLVARPFTMNALQSGIIGGAGNITAQLIMHGTVTAGPAIEQFLLNSCFIAPVVSQWLPVLGGLGLHWTAATAVDQFMFSPLFNISIFYFITAAFKGGVTLAATEHAAEVCVSKLFRTECSASGSIGRYELAMSLYPGLFPPLLTYAPVWSTLVNSYYLWLPACVVREKYVPAHLKQLFCALVAFVWSIIFSLILASTA